MPLSRLLPAIAAAFLLAISVPAGAGVTTPSAQPAGELIPAQRFELDNGLRVIFHLDHSDPVVAVVLAARVGSARELPGRTGFAHLFEHLFFLDSENLGPGGLDRLSTRVGGSGANGSTSFDLTDYLQTVPSDALEKLLWAEADKLGFFINTVSDAVLAKEIQVVKNEKRQSVDNRPYGHNYGVILEHLYPQGHPYSWPVIGSLADLDAATLEDVHGFYHRWYTPNNTTLVVAGDFDPAQAREWVEKYFGEIARGEEAAAPAPQPARLEASTRLLHEDNLARLPALTLAWPGVERGHPDEAALDVLAELLTDGRDSPLTAVVVEELKLASAVSAWNTSQQIAGMVMLQTTAFDGVDLDDALAGVEAGMARFERDGVDAQALERIKTMSEADMYARQASVLGKGAALARHDLYGTSPDADLAALRAVTAEDVVRVYNAYLRERPHVATSFVPRGQAALALEGSQVAPVVEEPIVQGAEDAIDPAASAADYARTPSSFDRSIEPPFGPPPVVTPPQVWSSALANGLQVSGIEHDETPLVHFQLAIDGGRLFEDPQLPGTAGLLARMLDRGTRNRTAAEMENAFKALGAAVGVEARDERFVISGRTLSRNLDATLALVEEMLLEPRWDEDELALARAAAEAQLAASRAEPGAMAGRVYDLVAYGPEHILSRNALGSESALAAIDMDDLRRFMARSLAPQHARIRFVGPVGHDQATDALASLGQRWQAGDVSIPAYPAPAPPAASRIHFHDMPGATQSMLLFGYPALTRADPDFHPATMMNFILGGGGFASRLMQSLREEKGYSYGFRSGFSGDTNVGHFTMGGAVRANVTLEAAQLARDIARDYGASFTADDLQTTRESMGKRRALAFETPGAKLGILAAIGDHGLPADYLEREAGQISGLDLAQVRTLADRHLRTDAMIYVVVGDAATQAERLEALGYGPVEMMNEQVEEADR
ncbi:M16 family metallopeptidase [Luteimonas dalianensis]|uniref:M16 family metallopeptidase n=1 Tax=Luteimonas dalianensis TaxID=1148196 RepID=UPI003BF09802